MRSISLFILFILCTMAHAQVPVNLTFFSEEGERFWVILDGVRQNDMAAANVVVEDLTKTAYRAKIIFEDDKIKSISQTVMTRDVDDKPINTSYIITKRTWTGKVGKKMLMRVSSFEEAKPKPVAAAAPPKVLETPKSEEEPKEEDTVPDMAISMLRQASDLAERVISSEMPAATPPQQAEIQIEMETDYEEATQEVRQFETPKEAPPCNTLSQNDFKAALKSIDQQAFEDARLSVAQQVIAGSCVTVEQVKAIISSFSFEKTRLDFAKQAWHKTTDKNRYFILNDSFSFSSSTKELAEYIQQQD